MHIGSVSHLTSGTVTPKDRPAAYRKREDVTPEVTDTFTVNVASAEPKSELVASVNSSPLEVSEDGSATTFQGESSSSAGEVAGPGFDPKNLDRTTSPAGDFYQFAMGGYLAAKPIPPDRERFGVDAEITIRNEQTVKEILTELAGASQTRGTVEQKLGDFFKSGMNVEAIEKAGLAPLRTDLARIEAIGSRESLASEIESFHAEGNSVYFSFYGTADSKDASQTIGEFSQGGLTLPEPEYYTSDENKETLAQYEQHVARMFELAGQSPEAAKADARSVVEFETKLAKISLSTVDLRDPEKLVNKKTLSEMAEMSQAMDWKGYLSSQQADGQDCYNVATPSFFEKLDSVMGETPLEGHKAYLRWHLLTSHASALPQVFERESFEFFDKTLEGVPEQKPRIDRIAAAADVHLGEALGEKFVARRFSPEAKTKMLEMVEAFKDALKEKISNLSWMSPPTREAALEKLSTFRAKIGYPDKPQDYAKLEIGDGYLDNLRASARYQRDRNMAQIGKPVDKEEWGMTASTNNAYYSPTANEICFPAGILQPPYFDLEADEAMNFGAIGATIGHELGHGFDDEGAQFDAFGNLRNWFAPEDLEKFKAKTLGVEKQFDEYVVEGLKVDGKLVLGEALADLSGLELAYAAFKKATEGKTPELIDGFTPDQRFFLSFAQSWATNVRPDYAKLMVKSDPHPHPKLRVNGTVSNMPEFFEAFGVRPGQPMRRPEDKRNEIWR